MRKFFVAFSIILCVTLLCACAQGRPIAYGDDFDMTQGILTDAVGVTEFKVGSYNIKGGATDIETIEAVEAQLSSAGVDIAGLQEVDRLSERSGYVNYLTYLTQGVYSESFYSPVNIASMGDTYGIATISKNKIGVSHTFALPYPYDTERGEVELRVVSRILTLIDGVQIAFYNAHLSYENATMPDGTPLRTAQIAYILELLQKDPVPYKILTGDFNVESFEEFAPFTAAGYGVVNNADTPFETYRGGDASFNCIDNIVFSSALTLEDSGMTDSAYSDHNMLYASFTTIEPLDI